METQIKKAIFETVDRLIIDEADILLADINERTISHRFAIYLQPYFPDWDIDCEYNRNIDDPKRLDIIPRNVRSDDTQATTVYPDIVVHKRKTDINLLVVEMKKLLARKAMIMISENCKHLKTSLVIVMLSLSK